MREILFKAKRIDNGEWVKGSLVIRDEQYFIFTGEIKMFGYMLNWVWHEVNPSTICQYTGLTDKNGNKIWENDVVICTQEIDGNFVRKCVEIGFVEMKHGAYGLHRKQGYYRPFKDWLEDYEYEVIGNIFDNTELLEQ